MVTFTLSSCTGKAPLTMSLPVHGRVVADRLVPRIEIHVPGDAPDRKLAALTTAGIGGAARAVVRTLAEVTLTINDEASTASKLAPVICVSAWRSSLFQRSSGAPLRYQEEPLSASIMPYFLRARRITWLAAEYLEISKSARRRKRWPMGGYWAPVRDDASCLAGQINTFRVCGTVKRMACRISPANTSS